MSELTAPHLGIFCHLDRLWHLDGGGRVYFGLNLATTLANCGPGELAEEDWLWLWERTIAGIAVYGLESAQTFTATVNAPSTTSQSNLTRTRVRDEAGKTIWRWNPTDGTRDVKASARPLHAFLMSTGTGTYPIPEWLQLRFVFSLAQTDFDLFEPGERLVAAPVFASEIPEAAPVLQGDYWTWSYDDVPQMAYLNIVPNTAAPDAAADGSLIDLKTYWIRNTATLRPDRFSDTLESRLASAMDLGQRLIDALRTTPPEKLPFSGARDLILAALRDTAGLGVWPKPDGSRPVPGLTPAQLKTLATYDQSLSSEKWRALLRAELPQLAGMRILADTLPQPMPAEVLDLVNEFDRLQSVLADDAVLRGLVLRQYRQAGLDIDLSRLENAPLRARLLASSLGADWPALTSNPLEVPLQERLLAYLAARFDSGTGSWEAGDWNQRYPRLDKATVDAVRPLLQDAFKDNATELERGLKKLLAAKEIEATPKPHPIVLQMDRVERRDKSDADDLDFLRRIAGVGVLMREKNENWRCLNLADVHLGQQKLAEASAVPLQLGTRNGVPEVFIPYDNQPLAAKSPLRILPGTVAQKDPDAGITPLFEFPANKLSDWAPLPALRFGKTYQFAAYVIGNSGALPKELSLAKSPAALIPQTDFAGPPAEALQEVKYFRRVGIGALRVAGIAQPRDISATTPEPAGVYPLARDLKLLEATPPKHRDSAADLAFAQEQQQTAFLLLAPGKRISPSAPPAPGAPLLFEVRKPSVDLDTWDRWHDKNYDPKNRKIVWQEHKLRIRENAAKPATTETQPIDETLDDPAVTDFVYVEWQRKDIPGTSATFSRVDYPAAGGDSFATLVQRAPIKFTVQPAATPPGFDGVTRTLNVPAGHVYSLRIHSAIPVTDLHFELALLTKWKDSGRIRQYDGHYLFPGTEALVEVATDEMPTPLEVWKALRPQVAGSIVTVSLVTAAPVFRNVKFCELGRQLWRWDGRDVPHFPFAADLNQLALDSLILNWDAQTMGERPDSDQLAVPKLLTLDLEKLQAGLVTSSLLDERNYAGDPRALYFRFQLTVRSRYQGLFPTLAPVRAETPINAAQPSAGRTPWKRLLLPARPNGRPRRPLVKLVVPLTEAAGSPTPALMVILNEEWFAQAGLAERFKARIVKTGEDSVTPNLLEYGPDPIFSSLDVPVSAASQLLPPEGPVGFTFDTDSSAPLFSSSAFRIEAPALPSGKPWWYFAKLSFSRELDPALTATEAHTQLESEWTSGEWVQFLADCAAFRADWTLTVNHETNSVWFADGTGKTIAPELSSAGDSHLRIWVVLTQKITDAFGRPDQERFVTVLTESRNGVFTGTEPLKSRVGLRARILEVQVSPTADLTGEPLSLLFPQPETVDVPKDAEARILRISPPIDSKAEL